MTLSFGSPGAFGALQTNTIMNSHAQNGPDLPEINTEAVGFLAIAGEAKLQLLPTPWPKDNLPPPTANLMSIASRQGIVAAAGPDSIIIATTESIRKAYEGPRVGDGQIRPFQPQMILPIGMRVSQVVFTADEKYLVLSAEIGGGLAVYEVQSLLKGSQTSAFELSTNSESLRALAPNPTPEKGELLALVTIDGNLMIANLETKNFVSGANGPVLKDGVSCLSWSAKGKQLVAGLADGSAYQMTPEGLAKAEIPRPPNVNPGYHVSSLSWLENDVFLMVHNPSTFDSIQAPASTFHLVSRKPKTGEHLYQKLGDPAPNFGINRSPPHHFLLRLRDFPPNLKDLIVVASTASTDIGLFTRSTVPLASDKPASEITNVFTMTEMSDDSRRAQLPVNEAMEDTSPIGAAFDFSSRERVPKPIPGDEMDESKTPLPGLLVLNNEGVISSWWVVYSESVRQGGCFPGMVVASDGNSSAVASPFSNFAGRTSQSSFGQMGLASPSSGSIPFGAPSKSADAFGGSSTTGQSSGGIFGAQSGFNKKPSVWGSGTSSTAAATAASFGAPAFGAPAFSAPAFGSTSKPTATSVSFGNSALPGNRQSLWTTPNPSTSTSVPPFGQVSGFKSTTAASPESKATASPFGSGQSGAPVAGGFAAFASKGGFANVSAPAGSSGNIFASGSGTHSSPMSSNPKTSDLSFGKSKSTTGQASGLFGSQGGFTLGSSFKPDNTAEKDEGNTFNSGSTLFGGTFGVALGDTLKPAPNFSPEVTNMDEGLDSAYEPSSVPANRTDTSTMDSAEDRQTTAATRATSAGIHKSPVSQLRSFPSSMTKPAGEPQPSPSKPDHFKFATPTQPADMAPISATPEHVPQSIIEKPSGYNFVTSELDDKNQAGSVVSKPLLAPAPPGATSTTKHDADKASFAAMEPKLPPDFMALPKPHKKEVGLMAQHPDGKSSIATDIIPPIEVPQFSDDNHSVEYSDEGDSFGDAREEEGSGEDVTKDLSPTEQNTSRLTTKSSFEKSTYGLTGGNRFEKELNRDKLPYSKSLFGEIGDNAATILAPPSKSRSPRSPSPVHKSNTSHLLPRPDASRSVSAPTAALKLLSSRASKIPQKPFIDPIQHSEDEEKWRLEALKAKHLAEAQALIDEDDKRIQDFLDSALEGTTRLDEFVAHQDYVGNTEKDSVPIQVEAVYRDINSMIDTLGINSRTLKCFVKGHTERYKDPGRDRSDLERSEDWYLGEIENLSSIVNNELARELRQGRIQDVTGKTRVCLDLTKEATKLHSRKEELLATLNPLRDPKHGLLNKSQPLTTEQAAQQHDLRRDFADYQKLLGKAESDLVVLRTKLASLRGSNGQATTGPTVEAVIKTVKKMTAMAEKRSGDVDVLENQLRRLRLATTERDGGDRSPLRSSLQPQTQHANMISVYGRPQTPDFDQNPPRTLHTSLSASLRSQPRSTPPRKKIAGFTNEDKSMVKKLILQRKQITDKLKAVVERSGTRIYALDDV